MSDPSEKKVISIPAWQRVQSPNPSSPTDTTESSAPPNQTSTATSDTTETASNDGQAETKSPSDPRPLELPLIEQAKRFLEDPSIQNADTEKKRSFLLGKGLSAEDADRLVSGQSGKQEQESLGAKEVPKELPQQRLVQQYPQSQPRPQSQPQAQAQAQPQAGRRDVPPIVTYPEFLTQPTSPPPLITISRLLNTVYAVAGIYTTAYAASKYIIGPMSDNLAEARHEFSAHSQEKLKELNEMLLSVATVDPATHKSKLSSKLEDAVSEVDSENDSDPAELYHRDIGIQTSPSLDSSRRSSSTPSTPLDPTSQPEHQANRLKIMTSHLQELDMTQSANRSSNSSVETKLTDLTNYLNDLRYQPPSYSYYGDSMLANRKASVAGKDENVEKLKSEIRGVKGVLLSARNFPAMGR